MGYPPAVMRRRSVVAIAALIAAFALAGLPVPAGSRTPSTVRDLEPAAFTSVTIPANAAALERPRRCPTLPCARPATSTADSTVPRARRRARRPDRAAASVDQPASPSGTAWKPPKSKITGFATFYDNGTTAMRLPRGTVVRICGDGGCIQRTVTDYGPQKQIRIVDLYRPGLLQGLRLRVVVRDDRVTVSIY